jgi:hypothetical protein
MDKKCGLKYINQQNQINKFINIISECWVTGIRVNEAHDKFIYFMNFFPQNENTQLSKLKNLSLHFTNKDLREYLPSSYKEHSP